MLMAGVKGVGTLNDLVRPIANGWSLRVGIVDYQKVFGLSHDRWRRWWRRRRWRLRRRRRWRPRRLFRPWRPLRRFGIAIGLTTGPEFTRSIRRAHLSPP